MKILITGGSGFIGTRLIDLLKNNDDINITNYDSNPSNSHPEFTSIGDVRDLDSLIEVSRGLILFTI